MFSTEQTQELRAPLQGKHVKTREQAGFKLSYIEGWHAIAEANRIFGFSEWDRETVDILKLGEPREVNGKWRVAFMAKVRITVRTNDGGIVTREGCGYGSGIDKDLGSAHEGALKEAETDAMKRALMTFGNPFGLALYDKEQSGVEHKSAARSWADNAIEFLKDATASAAQDWSDKNEKALNKLEGADREAYSEVMERLEFAIGKEAA